MTSGMPLTCIVYNLNGTIDLLATREIMLGNPGEDSGDLVELSEEEIANIFLDTEA